MACSIYAYMQTVACSSYAYMHLRVAPAPAVTRCLHLSCSMCKKGSSPYTSTSSFRPLPAMGSSSSRYRSSSIKKHELAIAPACGICGRGGPSRRNLEMLVCGHCGGGRGGGIFHFESLPDAPGSPCPVNCLSANSGSWRERVRCDDTMDRANRQATPAAVPPAICRRGRNPLACQATGFTTRAWALLLGRLPGLARRGVSECPLCCRAGIGPGTVAGMPFPRRTGAGPRRRRTGLREPGGS